MPLAHVYAKIACYSDKEKDYADGEKVFFKDGSSADLRTLTIANKGTGEILFRYEDQFFGIGPKGEGKSRKVSKESTR